MMYAPRITVLDIEIRAAVMRRMFPNGAQLSAERRREVFEAYCASDEGDARMVYWAEEMRAAGYGPAERAEGDAYARFDDFEG